MKNCSLSFKNNDIDRVKNILNLSSINHCATISDNNQYNIRVVWFETQTKHEYIKACKTIDFILEALDYLDENGFIKN